MTGADSRGLITHPRPKAFPIGPESLADILVAAVAAHPDRAALIDGERTWTYSQLDAAVGDVASAMTVGQVVRWTEPSSAELVIALLATFRVGGIWISSPSPLANEVDLTEWLADLSDHRRLKDPFGAALVTFTSGTSGRPKAVVHSEHSLLAPGLVSIETEQPLAGERIGTPLDLRNANASILGPISAFLRGSTFVVMRNRFAPRLAGDIATHNVTRLFLVPALAFDLAVDKTIDAAQLRSLDRVILGGSGADPAILTQFTTRFGVRPTMSYGFSEAPTGVARESPDDPIGSGRGFPLPHVEIVIVGDDGAVLDTWETGEICVRATSTGPWANCWTGTLGYLGEPARTDRLFRNGLLHTGDLGSVDADGAITVMGRIGTVINRGGTNVDPMALVAEAQLIAGVADAVVVGLTDPRLGNAVGLAIQPEGADIDGVTVVDRERLLHIAKLLGERTGTRIDAVTAHAQWPRSAMGKIDRSAIIASFGPETWTASPT